MPSTAAGPELHVRDAGAGEPLLFVHGFPFDGSLWERQLAALPPGWRGIAPDLRGFGESPLGGAEVHGMDLFADDLAALLDRLRVPRAVVCGLSMGGYVAFALWRRHPERVRALVLADTRPGADTEEGRAGRTKGAAEARAEGTEGIVAGLLPKLLAEGTRAGRPEVVEGLRAMMARQAPEAVARALLGMAERPDSTADLAGVDVPTLVVVGQEDAITPVVDARAMAEAMPGARLEILSGAGHLPPLEAPDAFNRALATFLNDLHD